MERYNFDHMHNFVPHFDGEWVKYSDAQARVDKLKLVLFSIIEWESFGNHIDEEIMLNIKQALND